MRERDRAISRLITPDKKTADIVDDLTRVLANKLLTELTFSIRASAEEGDLETVDRLVKAITQGEKIGNEKNSQPKN